MTKLQILSCSGSTMSMPRLKILCLERFLQIAIEDKESYLGINAGSINIHLDNKYRLNNQIEVDQNQYSPPLVALYRFSGPILY